MKAMLRVLVITLACASFSGCGATGRMEPETRTQFVCLPMADYSPETQTRAADELDALPEGSALATMVRDYGAIRAANRACLAGR